MCLAVWNGGERCLCVRHEAEKIFPGGFHKLVDVHFDHFAVLLLGDLFNFHASHFRESAKLCLLLKRREQVTGHDHV